MEGSTRKYHWVCRWTQYAPPAELTADGWYHGSLWWAAHKAAPRDVYLRLDTIDYDTLLRKHAPELRFDAAEDVEDQAANAFTDNYATLGNDPLTGEPVYVASDQFVNMLKDGSGNELAAAGSPGSQAGFPRTLVLGTLGMNYWFGPDDQPLANESDWLDARGSDAATYRSDANRQRQRGYDHTTYARAVHDPQGDLWLQYWVFYYYNSYASLVGGPHEGDWEMIQVRLDGSFLPDRVTYSQHIYGQSCAWSYVEKATYNANVPVVYVAAGSHAAYLRSDQTPIRPFPDFIANDQHHGDGNHVRPAVEIISETEPRWVQWPGRWGASTGTFASPQAPSTQPRWSDPSVYHDAQVHADRPC